jgi:hypothetical protein
MSKIEMPPVMTAIIALTAIGLALIFLGSDAKEIVGAVVTGIGMLGMKLLEKNGDAKQ